MTDKELSTQKRTALLASAIASFLTPFMGSAVNVALPVIGSRFQVDAVTISWLATSYILTAAMCLLPFGRLADIRGRKRIFNVGILIFGLASILAALAPNYLLLLISRLIQGIGSAMVFGTGLAIVSSVFPPGERGRIIGINIAVVYLGLSLGPPLGGMMVEHLGWRSIFLSITPLCILTAWIGIFRLKGEWAESRNESMDWRGTAIYMLALLTGSIGITHLKTIPGIGALILSAVVFHLFLKVESKTEFPVLNVRAFRSNRLFIYSNLAALINYGATFAVGLLLSFYLQKVQGWSPQKTGFLLIIQPLIQAAFSPLAGKLSDFIEPRKIASIGMAITCIGLFLLTRLSNQLDMLLLDMALGVLGFGFALFSSPNTNAVMSCVDRKLFGVASGVLGSMRLLGQMASMSIVTFLFSIYLTGPESLEHTGSNLLSSIQASFYVLTALCAFGIIASLARGVGNGNSQGYTRICR